MPFRAISKTAVVADGLPGRRIGRVRQQRGRVIVGARLERLRPGLLDDIVGADIRLHEQRIDSRAGIIQLGRG